MLILGVIWNMDLNGGDWWFRYNLGGDCNIVRFRMSLVVGADGEKGFSC